MIKSVSVLYIDDEPDIREIAVMALTLEPRFEVETAASGEDALSRLMDKSRVPDVILLDVMMPGVDGPKALQRLRQIPWLVATPVIFITARARESELTHFLGLGAAAVITKPFDPMTLASQVKAILGLD